MYYKDKVKKIAAIDAAICFIQYFLKMTPKGVIFIFKNTKMRRVDMEFGTLHTKINKGTVVFNAPNSYEIEHRTSGATAAIVKFQKGPVQEEGLNGIFMEDLILICIDQLEHFQNSEFACQENEDTLRHLRDALHSIRSRQYDRTLRGVQGRNEK